VALLVALGGAIGACADDSSAGQTSAGQVASSGTDTTRVRVGVASGDVASANRAIARADSASSGADSASAATVTPKWITDANVLSLLSQMSAKQIAAASTELQAWSSDTVRAFAAAVAREHADLQHSIDSVAGRLRMTPVAPALAASIDSSLQAPMDSVAGLRGKALDRAFVRAQIARTQMMANYIDQFSSVVERPELQDLLMVAATRVGTELGRARTIQAMFTVADSAAADSAAKVTGPRRRATTR
jgi:predicted outer membrane protein